MHPRDSENRTMPKWLWSSRAAMTVELHVSALFTTRKTLNSLSHANHQLDLLQGI